MIRPGSLSVREPRQTFSPDSGLRNLQLISQTRPTLQTQRKTRSFRRFLVETKRELLTSPVRSLEDFSSASSSPQEGEDLEKPTSVQTHLKQSRASHLNSMHLAATDEKHEEGIKLARRTLQVTFTCNKCGEFPLLVIYTDSRHLSTRFCCKALESALIFERHLQVRELLGWSTHWRGRKD